MPLTTTPLASCPVNNSSHSPAVGDSRHNWRRDTTSNEVSDTEAQPFLPRGASPDEREKKHLSGNAHKRQSLWLFLIQLLALTVIVGALAGLVLNLAPREAVPETQPSDDEVPHSEDLESIPQGGHQQQQAAHDLVIQYHEDPPQTPELRPPSEYELPMDWDLDAAPTTREYFWTIQDGLLNPDGVFRPMMLINNRFPGPLVECNEGDRIVVHVENRAVNATSIHFHGLYQNGTNDMDGSVGITQCAIAPGATFSYNFTVAGQSGTYWYHAHHTVQASDGLVGPMVIHSRDERTLQELDYASDRIVMVQDHYHNTTDELLMDYLRPDAENNEPVPDNALINGMGLRDCDRDFAGWPCDASSRSRPEISLTAGQRHRLRFINVGAFAEFQIEVDEHSFYVTEVDGTDVHPEPFHRLNILPAQRYSIIVETNNTAADAFWMRTRMVTHCFTTANERLEPELWAIIRYETSSDQIPASSSSSPPPPSSKPWSESIEVICRDLNTSALHPVVHSTPPPADEYISLRANFMIGDWRLSRGFFNSSTWHANMTHPSLHRLLDANLSTSSSPSIHTNTNPFDTTQDFVLQTTGIRTVDIAINSFDDGSHPFHLHGHKFYVLGQSRAGYPPSSPAELSAYLDENHLLDNPLRRDVVTVEGYAWTIIRVVLDNPGLWAFHCHNAWHAAAGMVMQVLVRSDEVLETARVSEEHRRLCRLDGVNLGDRPDDSIWFGDLS